IGTRLRPSTERHRTFHDRLLSVTSDTRRGLAITHGWRKRKVRRFPPAAGLVRISPPWEHAKVPAQLSAAEAFVRAACLLRPVPQVEEVRLHLADDVIGLWQRAEDEFGSGQPPPFWAFAWPGGQALARYLLDHPETVAGRRVLDVGSG